MRTSSRISDITLSTAVSVEKNSPAAAVLVVVVTIVVVVVSLLLLLCWQRLGIEVLDIQSSPNGTSGPTPSPGDGGVNMTLIIGVVAAVVVAVIIVIIIGVLIRRSSKSALAFSSSSFSRSFF